MPQKLPKTIQFEWDSAKDEENQKKHGLSFSLAIQAFYDEFSVITNDPAHSVEEQRFFCYGKVGGEVATLRFTYRNAKIRIIGAAYWRKGKKIYVKKNNL